MSFLQSLVKAISVLKQNSVSGLIKERMYDFEKMHFQGNNEWFSELCFCLLTANTSAQMGLKMQSALSFEDLAFLPQKKLSNKMNSLHCRFFNRRSEFICLARKHLDIKGKVKQFENEDDARLWLAENIKGFGLKESSHFLRNVGYKNLAILDRHVLNIMHEHGVFEKPKSLSAKNYFAAEKVLDKVCEQTNLSQAELDLYLWYMKTGKVLK